MPYANNNGVKIYYEVEGEGTPLVLVHGMIFSGESWRTAGYISELKNDYQLIILDVRGHGKSDKPDDLESYDFKTLAGDVITIMNYLNVNKAHYFGYSMGACVGFHGIAKHYLSRFNSLILGGFSVFSDENIEQSFQNGLPIIQSAIYKGMEVYVPLLEQEGVKRTNVELHNYLLSLNPRVLYKMFTNLFNSFLKETADEMLSKINLPCFTYAGEADIYPTALKKTVSKMPNARFISLPGLNHEAAFMRSDLVIPHIKEFLAQVSWK
jgi:pimeloyl-ACP methyl ester carboxylesterase